MEDKKHTNIRVLKYIGALHFKSPFLPFILKMEGKNGGQNRWRALFCVAIIQSKASTNQALVCRRLNFEAVLTDFCRTILFFNFLNIMAPFFNGNKFASSEQYHTEYENFISDVIYFS